MKKTRPVKVMEKPKVKTQVGLKVNISAPRGIRFPYFNFSLRSLRALR